MRKINRDVLVPVRRYHVAERKREIRYHEPGAHVPHQRADEDLHIDDSGGRDGQRRQWDSRRWLVHMRRRFPARIGEDGDRHHQAKQRLRRGGVCNRDRERQFEQHRDSAENRLHDDQPEREHDEPADPSPRLRAPRPRHQHERQNDHSSSGQPMAIFEPDAALPRRDQFAERQRPVRNGERGTGRGDQPADEDEAKGGARGQHRKAMQSARLLNLSWRLIHK